MTNPLEDIARTIKEIEEHDPTPTHCERCGGSLGSLQNRAGTIGQLCKRCSAFLSKLIDALNVDDNERFLELYPLYLDWRHVWADEHEKARDDEQT